MRAVSKRWLRALLLTCAYLLGALGILASGSSSSGGVDVTANIAAPVEISGSVGDGPMTGATVVIYDKHGQQIGTGVSDNTASFRSTVKAKGKDYPLRLEVTDGFDLVTAMEPDFEMSSVMLSPSDKQVNINPFTTLVVKIAQAMPGGVNRDNVRSAKAIVTDKLGFGLDPALVDDPVTARITDANVANIIKSSEALGEMVRRTRDASSANGKLVSGDDVMDALAADMVDGFLDGAGAVGASPALAAVANVVSGQVLVDALSNNLKVGGIVATRTIDQAIISTHPDIALSRLTGSVRITTGMLGHTKTALAAAQVLDTSSQVADITNSVSGISAGALPVEVEAVLPADTSAYLDNAVMLSTVASDEEVEAINQATQNGGEDNTDGTSDGSNTTDPIINTAPVISGSPAGLVVANDSYAFQPTATDADGDALTFSISSKPGWAGFSSSTGRLSGTPGDTNVGTYNNIVVSVSDGTASVSLPAFSIRVDAGNTAPQISGTPTGAMVASDNYAFQPTATDADGDALTFSISSKPGWAGFSSSTGRLSGTPGDTNVGTYNNIVISVSDGTASVSLPAFSIRVDAVQAQTGSLTLSWTSPVTRVDGTPLSLADINGFRIYYGESAGSYPNIVDVADGTTQTATVNDIPVGTYYIVMTTYDIDGRESVSTPEISTTVQ